jgi:hypothetical protein
VGCWSVVTVSSSLSITVMLALLRTMKRLVAHDTPQGLAFPRVAPGGLA